jgi:hypothetical protein
LHRFSFRVFGLKYIPGAVLKLDVPVCFVINEHSTELGPIPKVHASTADPVIVLPLTLVTVAIFVVVLASTVTLVVVDMPVIELSVREESFQLTVQDSVPIKSGLYQFAW